MTATSSTAPLAPTRSDPTSVNLASRAPAAVTSRVPPHDLRAEQALLGGVLLDRAALKLAAEVVEPAHFYRAAHGLVFEALIEVAEAGEAADLITLTDRLRRKGQLDAVGGEASLSALVDGVATAVHVAAHAGIVRDKALLRRIGDAAIAIGERARGEVLDVAGFAGEAARAMAEIGKHAGGDAARRLVAVGAAELLAMEVPPREFLLGGWLPARGSGMVVGPTGIGKTKFGLGLGCAVAAGGRFLMWEAQKPRSVLYVDGELPIEEVRERLAGAIRSGPYDVGDRLRIITPDLQARGIPSLATPEGQALVEAHMGGIELLMLDSLATLCTSETPLNEPESWREMQEWILRLRRQGTAVLFHHHTGKSGKQLGTVTREFVLDATIELRLPGDYHAADGARFEVRFTKHRARREASEVEPFEARLMEGSDGRPVWVLKTCEAVVYERIVELAREGMAQTDIANEVGRHKANVSRAIKRARKEGKL